MPAGNTSLNRRSFLGNTVEYVSSSMIAAGSAIALPGIAASQEDTRRRLLQSDDRGIIVWLDGGMSNLEFLDAKPHADQRARGRITGEQMIHNRREGTCFSPYFPQLAQHHQQFALIRTLTTPIPEHIQAYDEVLMDQGNTLARRVAHSGTGIPYAYINSPSAHQDEYFQRAHQPSRAYVAHWSKNDQQYVPPLAVPSESPERMTRRESLLRAVDGFGLSPQLESRRREERALAYDLLQRSTEAFDLPDEDLDRYGDDSIGRTLLTAQRLARFGFAKIIAARIHNWDMHVRLHERMESPARQLDIALSALLEDLHNEVWNGCLWVRGEIGRLPYINYFEGRDHDRISTGFIAGHRVKNGTVIGETEIVPTGMEGRIRTSRLNVREGPAVTSADFAEMFLQGLGARATEENPIVASVIHSS